MELKVIIVDDEQNARDSLEGLLKMSYPEINILAKAASVEEAYDEIIKKKPSLVFLDIEMPSGTAFDLLSKFENIEFDVVFVTAYNEYAIQAIKFSALDYLLKPVDIDELEATIDKYKTRQQSVSGAQLSMLSEFIEKSENEYKKIAIPETDGVSILDIDDIVRCESDGNYTKIFLVNGKRIITSKTLAEYDDILTPKGYYRVHRSHLVNINHISKFIKNDGGYLIMDDGSEVEISRRKKAEFIDRLSKI